MTVQTRRNTGGRGQWCGGGQSVERLPTLSAFDEERIVWLKNLEDDIQLDEERRRRNQFRRQQATHVESSTSSTPTSLSSSSASTCVSRISRTPTCIDVNDTDNVLNAAQAALVDPEGK